MEQWIHALILGIVEGFTEFLPISSTGHLILLIDLLGFEGVPGKMFEVVIQLGAILAICWLYRERLWHTVRHFHDDPQARHFAYLLVIGFIPAGVIGATFHSTIKNVLFSIEVVSFMLVIGGILILIIEKFKPEPKLFELKDITFARALAIGCCQALAVIPGTSRSGSTIMGSLLLGLDRKLAAEFSFFLAIPTMMGATAYDLYKNHAHMTLESSGLVAVGFIAAFIAALLSIKVLMTIISKMGFVPFAIYRIIIGSIMLFLIYA